MKQKTIAVIGLGSIGQAVATNLAKANRSFIAAGRNAVKTKEVAQKWGSVVKTSDIPTAVKEADILVLAIPFGGIATFMNEYAADLQGKIIVDPSNPIAPDDKGGLKKIIGEKESAGEVNAAALPAGVKLVKALGTLSAGSLASAAFQKPEANVLFYATDDTGIYDDVEQLILDNGFEPVRVDGIDQSIRLEVFGDLHEYGALGKTVTVTEAKRKL